MAATRSGDIFDRDIDLIDPDPENTRDMESPVAKADIEEIARSIVARGFDSDRAILIRANTALPGHWIVTDGHKRRLGYIQALELGAALRGIPARSEKQGTNEETRAILRLRAPGRELSPLEAVIDIQRLIGWNWEKTDIAAKLGKPLSWIDTCLELAGTSFEVRQAVRNDQVAPTEALKAVRQHKADAPRVIKAASEHAAARGKTRATGQDFRAVTRGGRPSIKTRGIAVAREWLKLQDKNGIPAELAVALDDLLEEVNYETNGAPINVHGPDTGTPSRLDA